MSIVHNACLFRKSNQHTTFSGHVTCILNTCLPHTHVSTICYMLAYIAGFLLPKCHDNPFYIDRQPGHGNTRAYGGVLCVSACVRDTSRHAQDLRRRQRREAAHTLIPEVLNVCAMCLEPSIQTLA